MSQTIHLPDELYERLAAIAAEEGHPIDALAESYVLYALRHLAQPPKPPSEQEGVYDPATDPLAPFIGAFDSGDDDPGWIERHDEYFAGTLEPEDRHLEDRRDDDQ